MQTENQCPNMKILVVDDEKSIRSVLQASLEDEGHTVLVAKDGSEGLRMIRDSRPDVVLLDIWMPGTLDGLQVLEELSGENHGAQIIVMSGHGSIESAVKATKFGAWAFIEKPISIDKVLILLKNISNFRDQKNEKDALLSHLRNEIAMIGGSDEMVAVKQMISRVAPTDSWVLINGENGTGKELIAKNVHYLSRRAGRPFVEINCAAIPEDLIESELFGYEKGAFTGALKSKRGKFDLADGGTIFLDEIADMSLKTQAKVLRILQEQKFDRVGGEKSIEVDVRVIAATNKDLKELIAAGEFREDLYYRLNVIPFTAPALRNRIGDIPVLVDHFSRQFSKSGGFFQKAFSEASIAVLQAYQWPGNVRELRNFVERVYILTPGDVIEPHDLVFAGLAPQNTDEVSHSLATFKQARAHFEKEFILKKIEENNGNISKTAEKIGLERSYLHRKIKSYGLEV